MLTVAKITGALAAGYAEYLQGKTTAPELGDYYLRDGERVEAAGRWVSGAGRVSADPGQVVSGDCLRALLQVTHPATGEALRRAGAGGTAVAAIDATFSAPKSVSAVWALADPGLRAALEAAHEGAIDAAMGYARERVAMVRERVGGAVIHVRATDVVATGWRHTTARAVGDRAPDPQLHTHVLLHAAVRRDGELVAIDSRAWLLGRRELGAAYRTQLAHQLGRLGFGIQRGTGRGGRYFEITGVPQGLIDRWSSRHHQVREAIENRLAQQELELHAQITEGGPGAKTAKARLAVLERSRTLSVAEERRAGISTRSAKTPATVTDLDREWTGAASRSGLHRRDLAGLRDGTSAPLAPVSAAGLAAALTELHATFTDREARAIALEQSAGATIDDALAVLDDAGADRLLLDLDDGRATTRSHRAAERRTIAAAEQIVLEPAAPIAPAIVDREIHRLERELAADGAALTDEQRDAVTTACGEDRLVMIDGQAGTGKSTVLRAVARAHQRAGQDVIVTSTAALAASRLANELTEAGVECSHHSTVALARAVENGSVGLGPRTTVIHDEAALASTRELDALTTLVAERGGRLVLVGDPHQSLPVGAGGLWPALEQIADDAAAHAQLTENVRARDPADRRDQALFRAGEHETALAGYQARACLHAGRDQAAVEDLALDAAQADRRAGRRTVVITQTSNDHLDELNARAQAVRLADGELGSDALGLPGRPYRLRAGDEIQIRHTINHAEHGALRNGTLAEITTVDATAQTARLELREGRRVTLSQAELDRAQVRLAYVQHPFPAQGITVDSAHLIIGAHVTRHGTYVGLTRAREHTSIYDAPEAGEEISGEGWLAELAGKVARDEPDLPSIAFTLAGRAPARDPGDYALAATWPPPGVAGEPIREVAIEAEPADIGWEW